MNMRDFISNKYTMWAGAAVISFCITHYSPSIKTWAINRKAKQAYDKFDADSAKIVLRYNIKQQNLRDNKTILDNQIIENNRHDRAKLKQKLDSANSRYSQLADSLNTVRDIILLDLQQCKQSYQQQIQSDIASVQRKKIKLNQKTR